MNASCAGFPTRDLGFTVALAWNAEGLAVALQHLGDVPAALRQASLARHLYEQAHDADPDNVCWLNCLEMIWSRIGKVHWGLGQADEALAALRESTRIQRRLFEADPSDASHRSKLDRSYGRLAYFSNLARDWSGNAAALLEREKLWPDDPERLRQLAHDFAELAKDVAAARKERSPAEEASRKHYLAESTRILRVAEAKKRDR